MHLAGAVMRAEADSHSDGGWRLIHDLATSFVSTSSAFERSLSSVLAGVDTGDPGIALLSRTPALNGVS